MSKSPHIKPFDPSLFLDYLPRETAIGRPLHTFAQIDSTNRLAQTYAPLNIPHGTVFATDFQSKGRGRLNRKWLAPAQKGLLFSLFLRPSQSNLAKPMVWTADKSSWLTMMAGIAVVKATSRLCEASPRLKWPNDLIFVKNGRWHKWGGILTEAVLDEGKIQTAIIGIGLNVNMMPDDLPQISPAPTSLLLETDQFFSREQFLALILAEFADLWAQAEAGHSPHQKWETLIDGVGQSVLMRNKTSEIEPEIGIFEGIDQWGRLLLRKQSGKVMTFVSGDVTLTLV